MPTPIYRFDLDVTGLSPTNLVANEPHVLQSAQINRILAPTYGAFFAESLVIIDKDSGYQLIRGLDFLCVELLQEASLRYGKEICLLALIKNQDISPNIEITYQVLGSYYQNNASNLINIYDAVINDNRPVDWVNVFNKPLEYPPSLHSHILNDVYGFQVIVDQLERLRDAIMLSNVPQYEALIDWVKERCNRATDRDIDYCENPEGLVTQRQLKMMLAQFGLFHRCALTIEELKIAECDSSCSTDNSMFIELK